MILQLGDETRSICPVDTIAPLDGGPSMETCWVMDELTQTAKVANSLITCAADREGYVELFNEVWANESERCGARLILKTFFVGTTDGEITISGKIAASCPADGSLQS